MTIMGLTFALDLALVAEALAAFLLVEAAKGASDCAAGSPDISDFLPFFGVLSATCEPCAGAPGLAVVVPSAVLIFLLASDGRGPLLAALVSSAGPTPVSEPPLDSLAAGMVPPSTATLKSVAE